MFRQIVYTSQASEPVSETDCDEILQQSRANNVRDGVTGFLLSLPNGTFVQTLEGPPDGISNVLERIREDDRHTSLTVILDHTIPARDFPDWRMGYRAVRRDDLRTIPEFRNLGDSDFAENFDSGAIAISIMKSLYDANR